MNNITFFTHLKAQFHKKFHLSGDTKDIYFKNISSVGPLGKIDDVRFVVSLPMNGKVVKWECSYKNEPMKNGIFNVTIEEPHADSVLSGFNHKFVLSLTTSLNNLSIETLLEGFKLANDYYKNVHAATEHFVLNVNNNEEGYQNFKTRHVSMTKDAAHKNKIKLGQLRCLFIALNYERAFDGQEDVTAYIDDYGEMILDAVSSWHDFVYCNPLKEPMTAEEAKAATKAEAKAENEAFWNEVSNEINQRR